MPTVTPEQQPFLPRGAACALARSRDTEVLLSGPAGTGKSRACLEKLSACARKYPGMRGLILRKTRASLTESALVTYEDRVIPAGWPILEGATRAHRQAYRYPNGSQITIGGLDRPSRVMSTEYDTIFVQEAIELLEEEWEALTTRLRNGKMPYQQLMADTNPDAPGHWLKRRCEAGKTRMLESRHEDNPTLWDGKQWTPRGAAYMAKLDALTGPRLQRLRHGRWVQAEGVVYDGWNAALHLVQAFHLPESWPRFLSIDFGYTNPFVCQWWAQDPDGRLYRYREIYRTQRLVEDHARHIKSLLAGEPLPTILCDHDAEDRATLERHLGLSTIAAIKDVSPGIQSVAARLRVAGDGKPRIFFVRDALVERDPDLDDKHKPTCTEGEFDGYVWDTKQTRRHGEEPVKLNDHGMDAMRYLVYYLDGAQDYQFGWARKGDGTVFSDVPSGVFLTDV